MKNQLPHLLIAEDDANFGMMLKIYLQMHDLQITLCENGPLAVQAFQAQSFDLCILDVMMPHLDGFSVAEVIAKSGSATPFVFLTAKALKEDQIKGYQLGAADYLIKPFDPEILLFKINLLLQKREVHGKGNKALQIGNYVFDYEKRNLRLGPHIEKLSPKEAELLKLLGERQGELLLHEEALLKIWQNDDYFTKQSMNVFITKLRKYLAHDPENRIEIANLHGKGFVLGVEKR